MFTNAFAPGIKDEGGPDRKEELGGESLFLPCGQLQREKGGKFVREELSSLSPPKKCRRRIFIPPVGTRKKTLFGEGGRKGGQ